MQNPHTQMITELASHENYLAIKELVGLWPEIAFEHHKRLFEDAFKTEGIWDDYGISGKSSDQHLKVVNRRYDGNSFFYFGISTMDSDRNWFFGIIGPWELGAKYPEIIALKEACSKLGFPRPWYNWMYEYFKCQRNDVYDLLSQSADVKPTMQSMIKEFNTKCALLKDRVEKVNGIIVNN